MEKCRWILRFVALAACCLWAGCGRDHYQKSADKDVYGIIGKRQGEVMGKTNDNFNIKTPYSDRKPDKIPSSEIIQQRLMSSKRPMTLSEALKTAVANSQAYQLQKETVYQAALDLTGQRFNFVPQWASLDTMAFSRNANGELGQFNNTELKFTQLFKSGGQLTINMINDALNYFAGSAPHRTQAFMADFTQPLLAAPAFRTAMENLTQAERTVVYRIRAFARYEQTFAVGIVISYFKLLQQRDVIRNDYGTYQNLVLARERAEALGVDRLAAYQVDQARQLELTAKSTYIVDVQSYQNSLDNFKIALGLPVGTQLVLDDAPLEELRKLSLPILTLTGAQGHRIAVQRRLDVQNEIDTFEDSKRKIEVAANALLPGLNVLGHVELTQPNGYDYSRFDVRQYQAYGGVQLDLPLDRLIQRNQFRRTQISFEVELRTLALLLDNVRNAVQQDLRALDQERKNYDIQQAAVNLAKRRVESTTLLLQAGRAEMRDLLDAQSALLTALNAFESTLVDYHVARWTLLTDLGVIRIDLDRFWVTEQPIPQPGAPGAPGPEVKAAPQTLQEELIPPEKLFR